jgi:hypothetical protein
MEWDNNKIYILTYPPIPMNIQNYKLINLHQLYEKGLLPNSET